MQILEGDLLRKMNSSRKKREIKGRKKEREQDETRAGRKNASRKKKNASRKKEREIKGRKKEREQEETRDKRTKKRTRAGRNMTRDVFRMQASNPKPSPCIK